MPQCYQGRLGVRYSKEQWQSFHNPDKMELSENMLGIYRSDRSMTPAVTMMRQLMQTENEAMPYLYDRSEDMFPILTLYATSSHYSIYHNQSVEALRNHIYVNRGLRLQSDVIPEQLFSTRNQEAIGHPRLIMIPGAMRLSDACFEQLMETVQNGCTVLISGNIEENEYFEDSVRLGVLEKETCFKKRHVRNYEELQIGDRRFQLDFRKNCDYGDTENFLSAFVNEDIYREGVFYVKTYQVGKGRVIYCPLPVELAQNQEITKSLYELAMEETGITKDIYSVEADKEHIFIHSIVYAKCTEYTIINEGATDSILLTDMRGKTTYKIGLPSGRSCKLWIGQDGRLVGKYANDGVSVMQINR